MNKKCENCYYRSTAKYPHADWCSFSKEQPIEKVCEKHYFKCEGFCFNKARFDYNGKYYCGDCLMEKFDLYKEETISYYLDGKLIGTSDDIYEVIENLNVDIKTLR